MDRHFLNSLMAPVLHKDINGEIYKTIKHQYPKLFEEIQRLSNLGITGVVAGGFAAYILQTTNDFVDVDLFTDQIEHADVILNSDLYHIKFKYEKRNLPDEVNGEIVYIFNHKFINLEIIFIDNSRYCLKGYSFYYELIKSFDLPIARKGLFILPNSVLYVNINKTFPNLFETDQFYKNRSETRKRKYKNRLLNYGSPMTLKELCQIEMWVYKLDNPPFNMNIAYDKIKISRR
ncbi:oxoc46 [Oxyplax ochracea nucleopolyhedrovirus]|uniref:Oxoc46 n=1 Tax=Oxyplax ochracea nucleopolyhedrovirus TaxID=2083176 RepID=A0A2L0WU22_9ABAC|nr:oxoc46 [Oxyplax ochracea nucleopolyhedrovirus]AVA31145.1 oxoc46 [Oxyplax ochracea nucleopolyhedrovirus]